MKFYTFSTTGDVYSKRYGKKLKPFADRQGYLYVDLFNGEGKKRFAVHRLIASLFIPNPENKEEVNHIDFDKQNNDVNNLEWVTRTENYEHSLNSDRITPRKRVAKSDKVTGNLLKVYESIKAAERDGYKAPEIIKCCKGRLKSHYGFHWEYVD